MLALQAIRVIGVGDRVGELALLYNAPRSASVRTLSPCVLWSIHREEFKAVQALTASGNLIARSTHLYHVPWLRYAYRKAKELQLYGLRDAVFDVAKTSVLCPGGPWLVHGLIYQTRGGRVIVHFQNFAPPPPPS